jgi:predicted 2-oxoglutarate/Fe(II)-dependent dioxygenase YbiX
MSADADGPAYRRLEIGDPGPWFTQRTAQNPRFVIDVTAGRYIVLGFLGGTSDEAGRAAIDQVRANRLLFDDARASLFCVAIDPSEESEGRVPDIIPGIRTFFDFDFTISRLYGAVPHDAEPGESEIPFRRFWVVLDPTLRVRALFPFDGTDGLFAFITALPPPDLFAGIALQAPILYLPDVFEPKFCHLLIDQYERNGGEESGFMREIDGKTVAVQDRSHKQRRDFHIQDEDLIAATRTRIRRHLVPEIKKVHQFEVTRMERYMVCCYDAAEGGHFRAHRDNTTKGTAHRRFAVSINLNDDFDGGEVGFPEYGPKCFKPPPGGAVVFSCSLLHAVSPVTRGRRYAFLPFLYDDAAARIREANNRFLGDGVGGYRTSEGEEATRPE